MLAALINTCNRPDRLGRCLEGLAREVEAGRGESLAETIVVDDGGTADLSQLLFRFANRLPLRMEKIAHAGRAATRNRALQKASTSRVLFLGDDVIAGPGLLQRHAAIVDPALAVVGPYPMRLAGSPPFRRWAEPNPQQKIENPEDAGPFFFATGNLSADRERLLALGGFDASFEVYGWEDIDLGLRFARGGGRIRFDPAAAAEHDHPPFGRAELWERERQMGFTAWQFAHKWEGKAPAIVGRMKFWSDAAAIPAPSAFRRRLGETAIALLDAVAPASGLNARLYERMVFSYRLEGVAEAARRRPGGKAK